MGGDVGHFAEMGQIKPPGPGIPQPINGGEVGVGIELRRGAGDGEVVTAGEAGSGDIPGEDDAFDEEGVVMPGVSRGIPGGEIETGGHHRIAILHHVDELFRGGHHVAPEALHGLAIDETGTVHEPTGIDEMGRGAGMGVEGGAMLPRPPTGGAGVIEMDVGHEHVGDVGGIEAQLRDSGEQSWQGRAGAGLHQCDPFRSLDQKSGDDLGNALELKVDGMNGHGGESKAQADGAGKGLDPRAEESFEPDRIRR